jgi:hypothetical protein
MWNWRNDVTFAYRMAVKNPWMTIALQTHDQLVEGYLTKE